MVVRLLGVPATSVVVVGDTLKLGAALSGSSGQALSGRTVTWTSSDSGIATVSADGLVRFASTGSVTISAGADQASASTGFDVRVAIAVPGLGTGQPVTTSLFNGALQVTVPSGTVPTGTVLSVVPASASVLPANARLIPGSAFEFGPDGTQFVSPLTIAIHFDSTQLSATQKYGLGIYVATGGGWTRVPQSAVSAGSAVVSAPVTHFSTYAILKPLPPARVVAVAGDSQSFVAGSSVPIAPSVKVLDSASNGVVAVPVSFTVTSGNGTVAGGTPTTDSTGVATVGSWRLGNLGVNTLTATIASVGTVTFTATAVAAPITSVVVTPQIDTIATIGGTASLVATATRATGEVASTSFTWLSRTPAVAQVSSSGLVTAVSAGSAYVVVSVPGGLTDSALVVVLPPPVPPADLLPMTWSTPAFSIGPSQVADNSDVNLELPNQPTSVVVTLVSDNPSVFAVPSTVTVPANAGGYSFSLPSGATLGTAHITASASGRVAATVTIHVVPGVLTLSLPAGNNVVSGVAATGFVYSISDSVNVATRNRRTAVPLVLAFTSSDLSVATLDSAQVTVPAGSYAVPPVTIHGVAPGSARISVGPVSGTSLTYIPASAQITVVPPALSLLWIRYTVGIGQLAGDPVSRPYSEPATTVTLTHLHETHTSVPATVSFPNNNASVPMSVIGVSEGLDTIVVSAPGYTSSFTAYTVVQGRGDLDGAWPQSLRVGDSTIVSIVTKATQGGNPIGVYQATTFSLATNSNIAFSSAEAPNTPITSVTVPAGAYVAWFYLKALSAGTGTVTVSSPGYVTYSQSVTINP